MQVLDDNVFERRMRSHHTSEHSGSHADASDMDMDIDIHPRNANNRQQSSFTKYVLLCIESLGWSYQALSVLNKTEILMVACIGLYYTDSDSQNALRWHSCMFVVHNYHKA